MQQNHFNIRVYGILQNSKGEILLSDECRNGYAFTKFPGGGLEWGEGIKECLIREFKEELHIDVQVGQLFYLTDFFQESAFRTTDQLISIYYQIDYSLVDQLVFEHYTTPLTSNDEKFRWVSIHHLNENDLTFPIDKIVVQQLKTTLH